MIPQQDHWIFFHSCRLRRQPQHFFLGRIPGFYAGQECGALGIGATLGEPSNEVGQASTHWASPYSLGEPSNEVRASHQTRLGEPVLRGRWASHSTTFTVANACACLALCLLGTSTSACSARLLKCLLGTASACLALCLLGTFS